MSGAGSEDRLEYVLDGAGLGSWDWWLDTNKVSYDRRWCEMIGLKHEETKQDLVTWDSLVHPDDKEKCYADIKRHLEGKSEYYENVHRMRHKDGSWVWILDRGRISERDSFGKPRRFTGTHFNITRFKESELLSSEIQRMANIGGWELDVHFQNMSWTEQTYHIHGIPLETPTEKLMNLDCYAPHERERITAAVEACALGVPFKDQFEFQDQNGISKWVEVKAVPVIGADGRVYKVRGTLQDVSEAKNYQLRIEDKKQQLVQANARLSAILDHSPSAVYECRPNVNWTMRFISSHIEEITGYPAKDFIDDAVRSYVSLIHPDDQAFVNQSVDTACLEKSYFDLRYRIIHRSGEIRWVWERGSFEAQSGFLIGVIFDVTVEIAAETEIKEVLRAIEGSAIVSTADRNGKILTVNDAFCEVSGYSREELIGQDHRIVNSGLETNGLFSNLWGTLLAGKMWSGEIRNRAKDGRIYTVKSMITPIKNVRDEIERFISIRFDLTEQKRLQQQLEEAQKVARLGSWSFDVRNKRIEWSKQMFELFGHPRDMGPPSFADHRTAIHPEDLPLWEKSLEQCLMDGRAYSIRFRAKKELKTIWIETIGGGQLDREGKVVFVSGTCQDITEKVEQENILEQQRLKSIHSAKLASLGEMSAGVAHEINNPLAIISGSIELLKKFKDNEEKFDRKIHAIGKAVERIAKIVMGLRKFSRSSDISETSAHSVAEVVRDAVVITESKAKRHSVAVLIEVESNAKVLCNAIEIEQVIINLINNGIDAAKEQEDRWVQVRLFDQAQDLVLQIIDSGAGVSEEVEKKLYQPFFTTKPVGQGTGLGLSISKGILEHHKATLTLNREFARTCFEVRFQKLSEVANAV